MREQALLLDQTWEPLNLEEETFIIRPDMGVSESRGGNRFIIRQDLEASGSRGGNKIYY